MEKIKIIIVDDHDTYRCGIRLTIKYEHPDIVIAGEAKSGADFFNLLKRGVEADIVLLDIMLTDMSGIDIVRRLKAERPDLKILIISAENTDKTIEEMLSIGVEGFISKVETNPEKTVEVVRLVMQGHKYFGRDISEIISRIYVVKKKQSQATSEFTEQEKRVIECCHEGLPAKRIADRLGISTNTVQWHKSNIFRKLGINSTLELVNFAVKKGIIKRE